MQQLFQLTKTNAHPGNKPSSTPTPRGTTPSPSKKRSANRKTLSTICALTSWLSMTPFLHAQEESPSKPITLTANITFSTDYRFRGISQTENDFALQGGFDATHESGFYVGTWASNLSGWGTFGGANIELDLYGGYATTLNNIDFDGGIIWYLFPGGLDNTSYGEIYGSLGKSYDDIHLSVGANYAPSQSALSQDGENQDNIYVYGDASHDLGASPFSFSTHLGYSNGNSAQGPNGWVASPTGSHLDWSVGLTYDIPFGPLEASLTYIDTDIGREEAAAFALINPGYRFGIGAATAVFAISGSF